MTEREYLSLRELANHFGISTRRAAHFKIPCEGKGAARRYPMAGVNQKIEEFKGRAGGGFGSLLPWQTAPMFIYAILSVGVNRIKIGISCSPAKRLLDLTATAADELRLLGTMPGTVSIEKELHARFAAHRHHREWFDSHPDILAWVGECLKST